MRPNDRDLREIFFDGLEELGAVEEKDFFIAFSGGMDSMVVLDLFTAERARRKAMEGGNSLHLHVLHFNHRLRGADSEADEEFVRNLCRDRGLTLTIGRREVRQLADERKISLELAAREARYAFFQAEIHRLRAEDREPVLCLAHHQMDQTESIFLHFLRGAGPEGLVGMRSQEFRADLGFLLFRPLLSAHKEKLTAYARATGLQWREDKTNFQDDFTRNKLRLNILPSLRKEFNPGLDLALTRLSSILEEENAFFDGYLHRLDEQFSRISSGNLISRRNSRALAGETVPKKAFLAESVAVQRRYLRKLLRGRLGVEEEISFDDIEEIRAIFSSIPNKKKALYDMIFLSDYESVVIFREDGVKGQVESVRKILIDPDRPERMDFEWSYPAMRFHFRLHFESEPFTPDKEEATCYFDFRDLKEIRVRTYQTGDLFERFAGGSKDLRRCMNEWKLSAELRPYWPVFETDAGILWLPHLGRSKHYKARGEGCYLSVQCQLI